MRVWLIHNPASGQRDLRASVREVGAYFQSLGWQVEARETAERGDALRFAAEAVAHDADVVFVAGGDGSLGETLPALAHQRTALAVLPAGTANVWALEIGLPVARAIFPEQNPLLASARRLAAGVVREMDLGILNERYFLLYASVGFDAHIVHQMDRQSAWKKQIGGLAYYLAGAVTAWTFRGVRARIVVDGKRVRRRIWAVWCANTQLYGGVIRIADAASADDGLLDIVVVRGHGVWATIRHFASFVLRGIWADPEVEVIRARRVTIQPARPLPLQVDGDGHGMSPASLSVDPLALRVLVPPHTPQRIFRRTAPSDR